MGDMNHVEEEKSKPKVVSILHQNNNCYYCNEEGHKRSECRFLKRDQKVGIVHPNLVDPKKKDCTPTTVIVVDNVIFLIEEDNYLNVAYGDYSWIVDPCASFNVSPYEDFFSHYKKGDYGTVKMRNHVTNKIVGIDDIVLHRNKLVRKETRHVPEMRLNLISMGKLDDASFISHFDTGKWKLEKGNLVITIGSNEGSLYIMQGKNLLWRSKCCYRLQRSLAHTIRAYEWKALQILA